MNTELFDAVNANNELLGQQKMLTIRKKRREKTERMANIMLTVVTILAIVLTGLTEGL